MSHVATVSIKIKDLAALRVACESLGLELREGQKEYHGYRTRPCDHAIGFVGVKAAGSGDGVELGLVAKDGSLELQYDLFGAERMRRAVGGRCEKLVAAYVGAVSKKTLFAQGFMPGGVKTLADGTVEMVFTRG